MVGALAHGLCLGADYFMDDGALFGPQVLAWDGGWEQARFRILPGFLSALTFQVFGDSPMAQHLWNLGLHLVLALVVFWGARVFLEAGKVFRDREQLRRAAFFAALVFACHPICSEALNYARCKMIEMVALFSVLAAIGTLRFCQRPNWRAGLGTLAVVVLAMISKDPGLFHSVGNVMIVVAVFANWDAVTRRLRRPIDWAVALLSVAAFFWMVLNHFTMWWLRRGESALGGNGLGLMDHTLTQGRVFWAYVQRIILPANLCVDHHLAMTRSMADVPAVLMTLGVVLVTAGALWMTFKKRTRIFGVLALLALAPLLLRFLYPISEFMVEYRIYPAMPWVAMLAGAGLAFLYERHAQVMKFVVLSLVVGGVLGSALRSAVWQDAEALAEDVLAKYPNNNRARNELQRLAYEAGDYKGVFELRQDVRAAVQAVGEFNAAHADAGRSYLVHWTNEFYLLSEARVALALADSVGSQAALKYIDAVVATTQPDYPEYFEEGHRYFKYGKPLVELRAQIVEFGAIQDQRIADQASARDVNQP